MTSLSDLPPGADPALVHPTWCAADRCAAPDRLLERGQAETDIPLHRRGAHFSRAHIIPVMRVSEVELTFELTRDVFQPVTDEPDSVLLSYAAEGCGHSGTLTLMSEQLAPLATATASMRDAFITDRNVVVDEVARSLRTLGCITSGNAGALLSLTTVHLTDRERDAVLEQFTPGGDV
ncbi:hypothetical protein ABZS66_37280 [Dactylosporangium sp. NPDC005572]|uniref:hypothetical protein n=1 Tax=Dactylosporangium sp. NPDC005572 TaxID=3156889 RepID=UPI0033AC6DD0